MTDNRIFYPQQPILPVKPAAPSASPPSTKPAAVNEPAFNQVLEKELTGLKFSQHALQRLQTRNIEFDKADMAKLNSAVDKAAQKAAHYSAQQPAAGVCRDSHEKK